MNHASAGLTVTYHLSFHHIVIYLLQQPPSETAIPHALYSSLILGLRVTCAENAHFVAYLLISAPSILPCMPEDVEGPH